MAQNATGKPTLYIVVNNHFDPTWRRCWDRRFTWQGLTYVSYADLEEYYLLDNLALAQAHPEYRFEAENTIVVRKFLERHPEKLAELKALLDAGRFAVTGGGETIIDANMVLGESLVRNYLYGLLWVEENLGQTTRLAVRNDAFGNSAQLPQILRGCEIAWATGMSYSPAQGIYWRGLDGSTIVHATLPIVARGGHNRKYAPCPGCAGTGTSSAGGACDACAGRGIEGQHRSWLPRTLDAAALASAGAGIATLGSEELLPNPEVIPWAAQIAEQYDVRFALEEDLMPHVQGWLDRVDAPEPGALHDGVELNPNNSGCWVTRIRTKQTARRQEYALLAAEGLNTLAALGGHTYAYPQTALAETWRKLLFTMFHDAITATHIDAAYAELQDTWAEIDAATDVLRAAALAPLVSPQPGTFSVINPFGQAITGIVSATLEGLAASVMVKDPEGRPVDLLAVSPTQSGVMIQFVARTVPALSARLYQAETSHPGPAATALPLAQPVIQNQRYRVEGGEHGILSIYDRRLGRAVGEAGQYSPGELILEHDEGSPWATLHPDQTRLSLGPYTTLAAAEAGPGWQRLSYEVCPPSRAGYVADGLRARWSVTLVDGLERVDFHADVDWDTFNHRLRVAMPVSGAGKHIYGIPYGMLERQPYLPEFRWAGANGDWPAINWAGVEADGYSVAMFDRGLPSYRLEATGDSASVILLSLLRSPAIPTYLHEPNFYTMTAYDGMRDAGSHSFDYALSAYAGPFAESDVALDAEAYNAAMVAVPGLASLPAMPELAAHGVRLASIKRAEHGQALILRLCEYRGRPETVSLSAPAWSHSAARTNLLERRPQPLEIVDGRVTLALRAWEITTVRLSTDSPSV